MHAVVAEEVRARYASLRLRAYAACGTLLAAGTLQTLTLTLTLTLQR